MRVHSFFDPATSTPSYVVFHSPTLDAVVIDPVLDLGPDGVRSSTTAADRLIAYARERQLRVHFSLETHVHADHVSASQFTTSRAIRSRLGTTSTVGRCRRRNSNAAWRRLV
jgi:glyoxylase-like metal-dependent hydrolase (beta-lactamase superfamily II)